MDNIRVSFLLEDEDPIDRAEIDALGAVDPCKLKSVRSPGAHRTQKNIPGYFWMAQTEQHVWYESRLELMILKTIDHEREVRGAISQPLLLSFEINGKKRRHVPDFLFPLKSGSALLLNVTSKRRLTAERNCENFEVCRSVADRLGWEYVTRTEPTLIYAANVKWLNGYKRPPWHLERYRAQLLHRAEEGLTIAQVLRDLDPDALARPALFHLMWARQVGFDSSELLSDETRLWRRS